MSLNINYLDNKLKVSSISLIIANVVMGIGGVLFFKWSLQSLLLVYWFESAIIGFFTILKIIYAQGIPPDMTKEKYEKILRKSPFKNSMLFLKSFLIIFFILHFGGFMYGHLVFLSVIFFLGFPSC